MDWELISDIILYSAIAVVVIFAILGIYQWLSRKSLKKVDRELLLMPLPFALMTVTYFLFDNIWVLATAPNNPTKPSFPSTHVMVVATIFAVAVFALPKYIKSKPLRIILDIIMLALLALVCVGRLLAQAHWPADVPGALVFSVIFATIYYLILKEKK